MNKKKATEIIFAIHHLSALQNSVALSIKDKASIKEMLAKKERHSLDNLFDMACIEEISTSSH